MIKILVTGASGFIGSYIVEEGLRRGYEVWAAVRSTSSRAYLQDARIRFAEINLGNKEQLKEQLRQYERFDYVVHAAGATKCLRKEDFFRTNTEGTRHLVEALMETDLVPRRFVFVSSLSVFGAVREEQPYKPILLSDEARPNTAYGESKWASEEFLRTLPVDRFPYVILRPTGVYGPREKDYFVMVKSIAGHVDFAAGWKPQDITFIYVADVVQAVYKALEAPDILGKAYFLSDGEVYTSRTFSDLVQKELGTKCVLHIKAPLLLMRVICAVGDWWMHRTGKLSVLNNDKYNILTQRNWQCDITPARRELGFRPEWPLERGVRATVKWYKEAGWL